MKFLVAWNMLCSREIEIEGDADDPTKRNRMRLAAIEEAMNQSYEEMAGSVDDVEVTYVRDEDCTESVY